MRGNLGQSCKGRTRKRSIPARAGEPRAKLQGAHEETVYPRACGGTSGKAARGARGNGLSPRVRGNHRSDAGSIPRVRSIPARAGEPSPGRRRKAPSGVYPCACGGTTEAMPARYPEYGLSPRVRGNLVDVHHASSGDGSIPARAGEPPLTGLDRGVYAVYPRACGGTFANITNMAQGDGLSPRVRGNRNEVRRARHHGRSIPARAGEPQRHCVR